MDVVEQMYIPAIIYGEINNNRRMHYLRQSLTWHGV